MRTTIYIDGLNFYYGCIKKTSYKWLDLHKLFLYMLDPDLNQISSIKYFTTKIKPLDKNDEAPKRQAAYLKALKYHVPTLEIHLGHFLSHAVSMPLASPKRSEGFVKVIKTEEKGSDVNLSLHLLNDAWLDKYDCAVIVSNDSDLAESMKLVQTYHPQKVLGLITPGKDWRTSEELKKYAHFIKKIRPSALEASQLPQTIKGIDGKSVEKPECW